MRILFSSEFYDPWTIEAYKYFSEYMTKSEDCEVFCTLEYGGSEEVINKYNLIDYRKISKNFLNYISSDDISEINSELLRKSQEYSLYTSPSEIVLRLFRFKMIISLIQPDVVIVWNGMADIRGMVKEFLDYHNIPFLYAEKGMLPNSFYIDEVGINARSSLGNLSFRSNLKAKDEIEIEKYIENMVIKGASAWGQPSRIGSRIRRKLGIDSYKNIIFFPGQVDKDTNITIFSPFKNVAEAVKLALDALPEETVLVVKPHPKSDKVNTKELIALRNTYPTLKIIEDANIWDLIEISDLVISINSTVAFETLLKSKKVILLGDGVLSNVDLIERTNPQDLNSRILSCLNMSFEELVSHSKILSFLKFLLEEYYVFRNSSFPDATRAKIKNKSHISASKYFTRDELWAIFYKNKEIGYIDLYGRKKVLKDVMLSILKRIWNKCSIRS